MTNTLPPESTSPSGPSFADRALALIGLSLCEAASRINLWSLTLLWLTFITALLGSRIGAMLPLLMAGLVLAACQAYCAWRLAFDRPVFAAWARLKEDDCLAALRAFDSALAVLLQKNVPAGNTRSMADRVKGVRRLHLFQFVALSGQALTLLVLMIGFVWSSHHA